MNQGSGTTLCASLVLFLASNSSDANKVNIFNVVVRKPSQTRRLQPQVCPVFHNVLHHVLELALNVSRTTE
jgi:hypothetical protein